MNTRNSSFSKNSVRSSDSENKTLAFLKRNHLVPKNMSLSMVLGVALALVVTAGLLASVLLTQLNQDVRNQASGSNPYPTQCDENTPERTCTIYSNMIYICKIGEWKVAAAGECGSFITGAPSPLPTPPPYGTVNCDGGGAPGSCANRAGLMQICKNGYWSAPTGNECPTLPTPPPYGTVNCDGGGKPGTCANRAGLVQICKNGYWSAPTGNECKPKAPVVQPVPVVPVNGM